MCSHLVILARWRAACECEQQEEQDTVEKVLYVVTRFFLTFFQHQRFHNLFPDSLFFIIFFLCLRKTFKFSFELVLRYSHFSFKWFFAFQKHSSYFCLKYFFVVFSQPRKILKQNIFVWRREQKLLMSVFCGFLLTNNLRIAEFIFRASKTLLFQFLFLFFFFLILLVFLR